MNEQRGRLADLAVAFRGVTVTIATPFQTESLDLDLPGLRRNVRQLAGSGVGVIVPAGNTGEYHSLSIEEIQAVAAATIEAVGGRTAVAVGVGGELRSAIALAREAQRLGAAGVMLHEPTHTFVTTEGLYRYYQDICQAIDIGVALYKRSPRLSDELLIEVATACPNVVAIKYALHDVASYLHLVAQVPKRVTCACGAAERWALPFSVAGTTGFTSGIANFAPELPLAYWQATQLDPSRARELWYQLAPFEDLRARQGSAFNVPAVKYAMARVGLAAGPVRPPLSPVSNDIAATIDQILADWGNRPDGSKR